MNRYLLILFLPFIFSCSKNDTSLISKNPILSADCLKEATSIDLSLSKCPFDTSNYICEVIEIQEFFPLENDEKEWLKTFCLDDFSKIFFHDSLGNETFIEITENSFNSVNANALFGECDNQPRRSKSYCFKAEVAYSQIRIPIASMSFRLGISNFFSVNQEGEITSKLIIDAYTFENSFDIIGEKNFSHLVFAPEDRIALGHEIFPELTIIDKTFENVHSSNDNNQLNPRNPNALKIFYNKEFGIVSFIDKDGIQWVLND